MSTISIVVAITLFSMPAAAQNVSPIFRHSSSCLESCGGHYKLGEHTLINLIVAWLTRNFEALAVDGRHPEVLFIPSDRMASLRNRAREMRGWRKVIAFYDYDKQTIYLSDDWNGQTAADFSILVHEMVHHLQTLANTPFPCPEAQEQLAFQAQEKWLEQFDSSLSKAFQIDPLTLKIATTCPL